MAERFTNVEAFEVRDWKTYVKVVKWTPQEKVTIAPWMRPVIPQIIPNEYLDIEIEWELTLPEIEEYLIDNAV